MEKTTTNVFIPIIVSLLSLCCVLVFYKQLLLDHKRDVRHDCEQAMVVLSKDIQNHFSYRKLALKRMANRLDVNDVDVAQWKKDAHRYIEDHRGLKAIAWTDADFHTLQEVTVANSKFYVTQMMSHNRKLLKQKIVIDILPQERNGVLAFCATIPGARGYICAIIDLTEFLQTCLHLHEHYALQIWSETKVIYRSNKMNDDNAQRMDFMLENIPLEMQLSLSEKAIYKQRSFLVSYYWYGNFSSFWLCNVCFQETSAK